MVHWSQSVFHLFSFVHCSYRFIIPILKHSKQYRLWSLKKLASLYTVPLSAINRLSCLLHRINPSFLNRIKSEWPIQIRIKSQSFAGLWVWLQLTMKQWNNKNISVTDSVNQWQYTDRNRWQMHIKLINLWKSNTIFTAIVTFSCNCSSISRSCCCYGRHGQRVKRLSESPYAFVAIVVRVSARSC